MHVGSSASALLFGHVVVCRGLSGLVMAHCGLVWFDVVCCGLLLVI